MLYYKIIDTSKGIDPNKSNKYRECMICHYFFFTYGFKFKNYTCNSFQDFTMLSINIRDIASITVKKCWL